jgi:cyclopropane fatty-acyl-phospholipid synthase-like methyltransferase
LSDESVKNLEESVAYSLDGSGNPEIYPYIPYLLQDLWELGTSPDDVIKLIRKHNICSSGGQLLDLGCGKGAVSVRAAKELGIKTHGIDGMPEFIEEAKEYANKFGVVHLCSFETGDIRDAVHHKRGFDITVLGAVGYVFGDLEKTISNIKACLKPGGYIILDDWYSKESTDPQRDDVLSRGEFIRQIEAAGARMIDEIISNPDEMSASNARMYEKIETRAFELTKRHPKQRGVFETYLNAQREENDTIENTVICGTFLIQL